LIVGLGCGIVDIEAFRARLTDGLVREVFVADEAAYARTQARSWESFAARLAAKHATMKALRVGLAHGLRWTDVEIVRGASGELSLRLAGRAHEIAGERGVESSRVSVSHTRGSAIAMVVLEGRPRGTAREDAGAPPDTGAAGDGG